MIYSEAAYFDGNACQHVVAWLDYQRLREIDRAHKRATSRR